jgi:hypothetical protein
MKFYLLILLYILPIPLLSQSVVITKVGTEAYPTLNCEYIVLDENGKKIAPDKSEMSLKENGIDQIINSLSCENHKSPVPISVVLTIDNSNSMNQLTSNGKSRLEVIRNAAIKFIDLLHPDTEIAITHFGADTYRVLNYSTDKNLAKQTIKDIPLNGGGTDINKALNHADGSIASTNGAKYKKIIVFLTDGEDTFLNKFDLLKSFVDEDITLYAVSIYTNMDRELVEISNETGGIAFDNLQGEDKIESVFQALANLTSGLDVCRLYYISENCGRDRDIDLFYQGTYSDSTRFILSKDQLIEYNTNPKNITFYKGNTQVYYTNILSKKDTLVINDIYSLYSGFEVMEPAKTDYPIKLAIGERLRIRIANPNGITDFSDVIRVVSNSCEDQDIVVKYIPEENNLEVVIPNGGEQYYVGNATSLRWENSEGNLSYNVEYSADAGFSWNKIVSNYNALDFPWEKIPDTPTEEALLKVTEASKVQNRIQTHSLGLIDSTSQSKVNSIIKFGDKQYIMLTKFKDKFEYRNLKLDTIGQIRDYKDALRTVLIILDENLDPVSHRVFYTQEINYLMTSIKDHIFLLCISANSIEFDNLNYKHERPSYSTGVLLKIDKNLNLDSYKLIENHFQLVSGITYFKGLEASDNKLHLFGNTNGELSYDSTNVINRLEYNRINYLARIDADLNFEKVNYWDYKLDSLSFDYRGMQPISDDKVVLWGTGTGAGHLKLDTNFSRVMAVENDYNNPELKLKNYISYDESFDQTTLDYKSYKDINYYLVRTTDTTYYDGETKFMGEEESSVRLLAINDNNELLWDRQYDKFMLDKNIDVFDNSTIILAGRTNERILIGSDTIPRSRSNTIFLTSANLYNGEINWTRYLEKPVYTGNLFTSENRVVLTGNINDSLDFGNNFQSDIVYNSNYVKEFIWSLEYNTINSDISDSLWSIKEASFDYIDTIDFGKVYINSRKDSLVLDFITRVLPGDVTIINITIDDIRYETDFVGPVDLQDKIDVRFRFNSDMSGSNIARGTIETTQGKFYFYLLSEEIGDNSTFLWSYKEPVIDFGNVDISLQKTEDDWVVRNKSVASIGIDSVIIVNDINNEYSYNITTTKSHIYAFDTLKSEFTYTPKVAGASNAEVHFYLDVRREPVIVKLLGNGISKDSVRMTVSIDTLSAFPGNLTLIPVKINITDNPNSLDLTRLEVDLEYNATLLLPFRLNDEGIVVNKVRQITFKIGNEEIMSNLVENRFLPTIGNAITTVLDIVDVRAYNSRDEEILQKKIEENDGLFTLDGVCLSDGQYRLYDESPPNRIDIIAENGDFFVDYNLVEDGFTNLSVYDIKGKLVTTLAAKDLGKGEHQTEINTKNIANGNYILRLETPTDIITKIFTITK